MNFITALLLLPVAQEAEAPPSLQSFVDRGVLAGAVTLVADRDRVLSLEAVGWADVAAKRPMKTDDLFWIASQTKPITGALVMMLVDEGKLGLDDPVEKHLPEFKGLMVIAEQDADHVLLRKPSRPITIRDVLSHVSGMRFSSPLEKPTLDGLALKDSVRSHALQPLQWEPGSKYQYSNAGINTAARVLEVVAGCSFEEFLQKRLLDPLGMKDTMFRPAEALAGRIVTPHKPGPGNAGLEATRISQLTYPLHDPRREPMPAGGLFSTASDVARFCRMVLNGGQLDGRRYLSEASVKEMTRRQTPPALKESYGLGWSANGTRFGHGGALATNMSIDPERGLVTVYLVQHSGFPGDGAKAQAAFQKAAEARFGKR